MRHLAPKGLVVRGAERSVTVAPTLRVGSRHNGLEMGWTHNFEFVSKISSLLSYTSLTFIFVFFFLFCFS